MMQWKQRLYAFLLGRMLGPLLDAESLKKLSHSIEISLHEGSFVLNDVALSTSYLAAFLADRFPTARIQKARIQRLEINLTIKEHSAEEGSAPSSLAWRAMKLGGSTAEGSQPAVSLLANVEIDGVVIEIEPNESGQPQSTTPPPPTKLAGEEEEQSKSRSMLSSYVDAALSSLRLTLKLSNLQVRLCTKNEATSTENWAEVRLKTLSYHNVEVTHSEEETVEYETVLQKAVDFSRVSVVVGTTTLLPQDGQVQEKAASSTSTTIALLEGTSRLCVRAIEYNRAQRLQEGCDARKLQQDVEMTLDQNLNLSVDEVSLVQIQKIIRSFQRNPDPSGQSQSGQLQPIGSDLLNQEITDEADLSTIEGIMKQYQEARLLVERNEVRGGVLIPSTDEEDAGVGGEVTFDAFFDANEHSFSRYSSVMRESVILTDVDQVAEGDRDFVHSKIQFYLKGGGIKIAFKTSGVNAGSTIDVVPHRRPDEYLLLTFSGLNVSSSLSLREYDFDISVAGLDIEDSQVSEDSGGGKGGVSLSRRTEIGSVLQFSPTRVDSKAALEDSDLLVETPCISAHAKIERNRDVRSSDVDVNLEPFEITYRRATISNLVRLGNLVGGKHDDTPVEGEVIVDSSSASANGGLRVRAFCNSIVVTIPLPGETDRSALYDRCGVDVGGLITTRSSLGLAFAQFAFNVGDEGDSEEDASISCHYAVAFAVSPFGTHALERKSRRFDIFALSGLTEASPAIPVSVKLYRRGKGEDDKNDGSKRMACFPVAPMISSFKARQEDEDEGNQIDRVLPSKLQELETDIRDGLKANDPQADMLFEASRSDLVIDVHIPEIIGDLSTDEVLVLTDMVTCLRKNGFGLSNSVPQETDDSQGTSFRRGLSLRCDYASLTVHGNLPRSAKDSNDYRPSSYSYMAKLDRLKTHFLLDGAVFRHTRVLTHEVDFFEITDLVKLVHSSEMLSSFRARRDALCSRSTSNSVSRVTPVLHRSHLFTPISRNSPTVVLDIINAVGSAEAEDLVQKNVHLTLYDTTYRLNFDESGWLSRLRSMVAPTQDTSSSDDAAADESPTVKSLTRVFLSVADCNIDYSSSERFQTSSRSILRVGDLRLSSNLVLPKAPIQAFSLSLGDAAFYLCPRRFPYDFEDSRLFRSASLMKSSATAPAADTVLREMNYRVVLTLDTADAIVAVAYSKPKDMLEPYVRASVSVGEVSLFACKDSFTKFVKTVSELQAEITALDDATVARLRAASATEASDTSERESVNPGKDDEASQPEFFALDDLKRQSALRPSAGTSTRTDREKQFLLDGYDWTTIDLDESNVSSIPLGEDQFARWYETVESVVDPRIETEEVCFLAGHGASKGKTRGRRTFVSRIIPRHFRLHSLSDPLVDGDMGAAKYAGTTVPPQVENRVIVHDLTVKLRFFDGYDWPELLSEDMQKAQRKGDFVIDEDLVALAKLKEEATQNINDLIHDNAKKEQIERRAKLMGKLLDETPSKEGTFQDLPLPEERGRVLNEQAVIRRLARRTSKYFQVNASGVSLRLDSHQKSIDHRLTSCLNVAAQEFFLAETISSDRPVKMVGEWVSDVEHPRETKGGVIMLNMVSWHPRVRVTSDNEIANDESQAALTFLPLRCILDQRAIRFVRSFFMGDDDSDDDSRPSLPPGLHAVPPPLFLTFHVHPIKLKIDYSPQKINTGALRDGAIVELINLSPLEAMVLTLKRVEVENVVGFGAVISILVRNWIAHVCETQLIKFLTNTRALEPMSNVGGGAADMVILPWEAFQNGESIQKALRSGVVSFAKAFTYETLTVTSRFAQFLAGGVAAAGAATMSGMDALPSRPLETPRSILDTTPHAVESLARGLQTASYTIVIIPYREYYRSGTTGAVRSVLRGIPVALAAPASGAAEALSFALLGVRNQMQPDVRKEEEEEQRGLHHGG